eukprot:CAMPEP_0202860922 /NCGR_PEP_ID=MMETSP1391-20130828/2486_1 /ASSEMBLY_ACC=CAM_ASM_000867 /TAXON_ID=1034604 /ORGANISM="Chlamydomonas leiostraca, Strain SAG 11-49" /LENGTH=54 /DNA_ID=CAMNT_0049540211 /DNA_START=1736 /DNA_END=1900 /DNA_ORIENTATION=-
MPEAAPLRLVRALAVAPCTAACCRWWKDEALGMPLSLRRDIVCGCAADTGAWAI